MKVRVCMVLVVVAAVAAEPPRFRGGRFRSQRQELAPSGEGEREKPSGKSEEAPYPAAGLRPSKEFKLPVRQDIGPPATSYGVPDGYSVPLHLTAPVPLNEYGLPEHREAERGGERKEGGEHGERKEGGERGENREGGERKDGGERRESGEHREGEGEGGEHKSEVENVHEFLRGDVRGRLREREESEGGEGNAEVLSSQGAYYVLLPNAQVQRVQFQTQNDLRNMAYTARLQYRAEDRAPVYIYPAPPAAPAYLQLV